MKDKDKSSGGGADDAGSHAEQEEEEEEEEEQERSQEPMSEGAGQDQKGEDEEEDGGVVGGGAGEEAEELSLELRQEQLAMQEEMDRINAELDEINSGQHPDIVEKVAVLDEALRSKEQGATMLHELLLRNAHELHEFDLENVRAQYELEVNGVKEVLVDRLQQDLRSFGKELERIEKLEGMRQEAQRPRTYEQAKRKAECLYLPSARLLGGTEKSRRGPSLLPPEKEGGQKACDRVDDLFGLTDREARTDMQSIVEDWRNRAAAYHQEFGDSYGIKVESTRTGGLKYGNTVMDVGEKIAIKLESTHEVLYGKITQVSDGIVYVSLRGGFQTRIFMTHLSSGRLCLAREKDAKQWSNLRGE